MFGNNVNLRRCDTGFGGGGLTLAPGHVEKQSPDSIIVASSYSACINPAINNFYFIKLGPQEKAVIMFNDGSSISYTLYSLMAVSVRFLYGSTVLYKVGKIT